MGVKFDRTKLNAGITKAFTKTAEVYAEQLQEELDTPQWEWTGRKTERENGSIVGSPRDINDTGELLDSQQPVVIEEKGDLIIGTIAYECDHAAVVYTGWTDAQEIYPGREWDKAAQENMNVAKHFANGLKQELGL
jgi:cephalosporin hydroxylase